MEDNMIRAKVHRAVQRHCAGAGMQPNPFLFQQVQALAHEKGKYMKKKYVLVLLIILCLLLTTAAGWAWGLSREYFQDIAKLTLTSGDYEDWSLPEKQYMAEMMGKYGFISEEKAKELSRQEEGDIDAFMLNRYGFESNPSLDNISIDRIAWVEMGPYTDWDNETWVWYCDMMFEVGLWNEKSDVDVFEMPGEEAIAPQEAIRIAKEDLMRQGKTAEEIESAWHVWHYMTHASDVKREDMTYLITFRFADLSEKYVFLTPQGIIRQ